MGRQNPAALIQLGEKVSRTQIALEDKIWSKYSGDKVDIGETLTKVIRSLGKSLPLTQSMRAISIGSSNEPQFRILEAAFRGGLYLLDIDEHALDIVKERIRRQNTHHVHLVRDNFNRVFLEDPKTRQFLREKMLAKRAELVTLQHSMYYSPAVNWYRLIKNLYDNILAPRGAIYSVLMSSKDGDPSTTTWLYNYFSGKFCGEKNNQDLIQFGRLLSKDRHFRGAEILSATHRVEFFVEDFEEFMSVVWMVLLYPQVHRYSLAQRHEITEYVYRNFYAKRKPLVQSQDHLVIYRGLKIRGII